MKVGERRAATKVGLNASAVATIKTKTKTTKKKKEEEEVYAVVGSYEHKSSEEVSRRDGGVCAFRVVNVINDDDRSNSSEKAKMEKVVFETEGGKGCVGEWSLGGGVFDLKPKCDGGGLVLAAACANNRAEVLEIVLTEEISTIKLEARFGFACGFGGMGLCTSTAWSACTNGWLLATGDDGGVAVFDCTRGGRGGKENDVDDTSVFRIANAHEDAVWASTFLDGSDDVFFTGGDDCKLRRHDMREVSQRQHQNIGGSDVDDSGRDRRFEKNLVFGAGVTSIESRAHKLY